MGGSARIVVGLVILAALTGCGNEACEGVVTITTEEDLAAVQDCTHVEMFALTNVEMAVVSLPRLRTVERDLGVTENHRLTELRLPALESVGGAVRIRANTLLTTLELSATETGGIDLHDNTALESATLGLVSTSGFSVFGNDALEALELPNLQTVRAALEVRDNGDLERVSLPKLEKVGGEEGSHVTFTGNPRLTELELPALATISRNLIVSGLTRLPTLSLPQLTTVHIADIEQNPALTRISAPLLATVGQELSIEDNDQLVALELAGLSQAACVVITGNDLLPDCEVAEALDGVAMTCGKQSGNNKGDGCP